MAGLECAWVQVVWRSLQRVADPECRSAVRRDNSVEFGNFFEGALAQLQLLFI